MQDIQQVIEQKERELLEDSIRKSQEMLDSYLTQDFCEFWASGNIYSKSDILLTLPSLSETKYVLKDVKIIQLSENIFQIAYKLTETEKESKNQRKTLRSSLWRKEGEDWKMFFHQGTITTMNF